MSEQPTTGVHPPVGHLAEYVDGRLRTADRSILEGHLADCEECRTVVLGAAAANAQLAVPRGLNRNRYRFWIVLSVAASAAALILVTIRPPTLRPSPQTVDQALADLSRAVSTESTRPVVGRLSTTFAYAPPAVTNRGGERQDIPPDVRIAVARLEEIETRDHAPKARAALALGQMAIGDIDDATSRLEILARELPDSAPIQSDLSAAYLARASRTGRIDLTKALESANRALTLDPGYLPALFNRALVLEQLQPDLAVQAWRAYLTRDASSQWASEAGRHLDSLTRATK